MMKTYLSLAVKELKAQKIMAVLILLAVILSSVMTTVVSGSLGILQDMRVKQASSLNGDRYATFHQMSYEQMTQIIEDPRLSDAGPIITVGCVDLAGSGLTLFTREYLNNALDAYPSIGKVKEGRLPESPLEIALPENALQYLSPGLRVGDRISLQASISPMSGLLPAYEYTAQYSVCGILESNYIGYSTGTLEAVLGLGSASALLPEEYLFYSADFKVRDTSRFQAIVDELAEQFSIAPENIQYNWILLDALGISYREKETSQSNSGFSFMALALCLVGALVLLAAGLVIYNILKIAVTKRIKEYGTLRAIGGERGQIYRLVSLQLLILCGIGIPVGLLIGKLSAKGILAAATGILNPSLFMADDTAQLSGAIHAADSGNIVPYFISAAVTLLFAMLAAFPAARYASRVSPTVAMSGQSVRIKRRSRRIRKIHSFEAYYARLNLRRGRSRTVITILSLVMSITVYVSLQGITALLDTSSDVKDMHLGDYSVTNETEGISPESVREIRENEWVDSLATTKLSTYTHDENGNLPLTLNLSLQSWEVFHIAGVDDERLTSYAEGLSGQDLADLRSGSACIVKNPIPFSYGGNPVETTVLKTGDTITVDGHPLRVAGITQVSVTINNGGYMNGVQIIVSDEVYDSLTGTDRYSEVYPTLRPETEQEGFTRWLEDWCSANPGSHWLSYQQTDSQLAESFEQIHMLCWGLILFIGLIGILNIINTVYSNIHTRISEIGMQRAIGMSVGSLYRTFLWEGAYYGLIASVAGGLLGYICTVFIGAATTDALELVAVPYLYILEAAALSVAGCLLATAVPLRGIAKMEIVPSIEAVE